MWKISGEWLRSWAGNQVAFLIINRAGYGAYESIRTYKQTTGVKEGKHSPKNYIIKNV